MLELPCAESTSGIRELERPQEVACLLEVRTNRDDFVDQILHADNAKFAQVFLNELVVCESDTLLVDFTVAPLVDELTDRLEIGIAISDVWVYDCKHLLRGLGQTNEDAIVDLEESEKLKDLSWLWGNLADTIQKIRRRVAPELWGDHAL